MSFNPSSAHLAVGFGISALLLYGLAHAGGGGTIRFINVDGTTLRVRRMRQENGFLFEVSAWGEGVLFDELPSTPPTATFTFDDHGPVSDHGSPALVNFIRENMGRMPADLLTREECARPGCSI